MTTAAATVIEGALGAGCGFCDALPGTPCDCQPGLHLIRIACAAQDGLIGKDAVTAAIRSAPAGVFTRGTVIQPGTGRAAA